MKRQTHEERLDRAFVKKISPSSLLFYYGSIHSQRGQDGILAEIFRRLKIGTGLFVEFGAWDGVYLSNCRYLYERGWQGVFIEVEPSRYQDLVEVYAHSSDVVLIEARVGAPHYGVSGEPLAAILTTRNIDPSAVTFVSIDVDGRDLEIFLELGFSPPVVLMEGGFNFSPRLTQPIPQQIAWQDIGQPLAVIVSAAQARGYTAVCFYGDSYLVRNDLAEALGIEPKSVETLYADAWYFAPTGIREVLLTVRANIPIIQEAEKAFFGEFFVSPLHR